MERCPFEGARPQPSADFRRQRFRPPRSAGRSRTPGDRPATSRARGRRRATASSGSMTSVSTGVRPGGISSINRRRHLPVHGKSERAEESRGGHGEECGRPWPLARRSSRWRVPKRCCSSTIAEPARFGTLGPRLRIQGRACRPRARNARTPRPCASRRRSAQVWLLTQQLDGETGKVPSR